MARTGVRRSASGVIYILCALFLTFCALFFTWKRLPNPSKYIPAPYTGKGFRPRAGSTTFDIKLKVFKDGTRQHSAAPAEPSVPALSEEEIAARNKLIRESTQALLLLNRCEVCNETMGERVTMEEILKSQARREVGRHACLQAIRERIVEDYRELFENVHRVVLMDVTLHTNMGDSVLWRAAVHLTSLFGHSVNHVCFSSQGAEHLYDTISQFPYCDMSNIVKLVKDGGLVLYQGGGNWGNLYRFIQDYRMQSLQILGFSFMKEGYSYKVVQLPQTIYYTQKGKVELDIDDHVMNGLPKGMLTLFLRQQDGLDFANEHYGSNVAKRLSPDLALVLGPLTPIGSPVVDILVLCRGDGEIQPEDRTDKKELKSFLEESNVTFIVQDWHYKANSSELSASNPTIMSEVRLNEAVKTLSKGKIVITNRMHGSLIATLTGRILLWVDTQQDKIRRTREVAFNVSDQCTDENLRSFEFPTLLSAAKAAVQYLNVEPSQDSQ